MFRCFMKNTHAAPPQPKPAECAPVRVKAYKVAQESCVWNKREKN